jgi:hypothetical protein
MGGELEPRPENEFSISLATSQLLEQLGLKVEARYSRRWQGRARDFVSATAEHAETGEESLLERASEDDAFGDAFMLAGERAVRMGDPELRDLLAYLVARAFQDNTRIETVSMLLELAEQLQPIHLRVLKAVTVIAQNNPNHPPTTASVEPLVHADPGLTPAALLWLRSLGLVASTESQTTGPPGAGVRVGPPEWQLTDLGRELLSLGGVLDSA